MKKVSSIQFFDDIDLHLKFDFVELMNFVFRKTLVTKNDTEDSIVKNRFFDKNGILKMDLLEESVESYVNQKIKDKYGLEYSLEFMDDTMNISWDIDVKAIKKNHIEKWWDEEKNSKS